MCGVGEGFTEFCRNIVTPDERLIIMGYNPVLDELCFPLLIRECAVPVSDSAFLDTKNWVEFCCLVTPPCQPYNVWLVGGEPFCDLWVPVDGFFHISNNFFGNGDGETSYCSGLLGLDDTSFYGCGSTSVTVVPDCSVHI